jgi:FKBP-type peptidyl-prolyl cis-trans isomerase
MMTRSMIPSALIVSLLGTWSAPAQAAPAQAAPAQKRSQAGADAEKARKAGAAFLARNAAADGVVTLESGLQYRVVRAGDGKRPTLDDTVVVHYRGTLVDGTEFGSSYRTGRPGTFPLRAAIAGWREALRLMPAGSRWQLFVPPHLAYGERGGGGAIGPNATLIFETELISVKERDGRPAPVAASPITGIEVSFKLDSRLTRSLYLGDRWVSPAMFAAPAQGKTSTVSASARGLDASGKRVGIDPAWIPADPGMVQVTKHGGGEVSITVKRPGATKVAVVFQGTAKELAVRASRRGDALAVEISQ